MYPFRSAVAFLEGNTHMTNGNNGVDFSAMVPFRYDLIVKLVPYEPRSSLETFCVEKETKRSELKISSILLPSNADMILEVTPFQNLNLSKTPMTMKTFSHPLWHHPTMKMTTLKISRRSFKLFRDDQHGSCGVLPDIAFPPATDGDMISAPAAISSAPPIDLITMSKDTTSVKKRRRTPHIALSKRPTNREVEHVDTEPDGSTIIMHSTSPKLVMEPGAWLTSEEELC
jgi:hypothetical protein